VAEAIVVGMACLVPWAFGSVPAWAQLALRAGTAVVVLLVAIADGTALRARRLTCLPSLALAGLIVLALFQAAPLPEGLLRVLSPGSASLRSALLPASAERVLGDPGPAVPLPTPRLSQDPDETIRSAAALAAAWLLFQGVLGLGDGSLRRLAVAFSLNATLIALFSIVQALTWNGGIYWTFPSPTEGWSGGGPFVCHTHLAEYLNMGLGLALGLVVPGGWRDLVRGKTYRLWGAYAAVVIASGVVASSSRGGFLAMLAAGSVLALVLRKHALRLGLGAAAILVMVAMLLASLGDASPYLGRIATIIDPGDGGYSIRIEAWRGALRAWWDYPAWGTGLGSFPEATVPYLERERGTFFARAENEYVDLLAEGGLAGVCLLAAFGYGVARLARRAWIAAGDARERGLVLGASFGVIALGFNSLSDFGPHIPGVGVPAIILIATLCRMGLAAGPVPDAGLNRIPSRVGWALCRLASVALGLALVSDGFADARVEAWLDRADLPLRGEATPGMNDFGRTDEGLRRQREALEASLRLRPDWADGHLRLGMLHLTLYERMAAIWLREAGEAGSTRAADPLWLFGVVHRAGGGGPGHAPSPGEALLEHDPVRLHLVPAARSFLEARRCCPVSALAHAHLASLDYLVVGGEPASVHLNRSLRLAGNGGGTLTFAAEVASRAGEAGLAARAWRGVLEVGGGGWAEVADAASEVLTPEQILEDVVPNGRLALRFAERLYPEAKDRSTRERFLRAAARRLPDDRDLDPAERLQLEASAWAALDESEPARERMEAALALEPRREEWRGDYISWLLRWGRFDDAHAQARVWLYFVPNSKAAGEALEATADALARHGSPP
jgi:hypothetical protein